jgi:hypothetical protein
MGALNMGRPITVRHTGSDGDLCDSLAWDEQELDGDGLAHDGCEDRCCQGGASLLDVAPPSAPTVLASTPVDLSLRAC